MRVGDHWANYGNSGTTERRIVKVDDVEVGPACADLLPRLWRASDLLLARTFRRWWRTAFLDFTLDWEGRETDGRTLKVPKTGSRRWAMAKREQCCPKCKGTSGYRYFETAATGMSAYGWGIDDVPEADGTYGRHYGPSLYECLTAATNRARQPCWRFAGRPMADQLLTTVSTSAPSALR